MVCDLVEFACDEVVFWGCGFLGGIGFMTRRGGDLVTWRGCTCDEVVFLWVMSYLEVCKF